MFTSSDAAAGKDGDAMDDPRKLRAGEIDPSPETKPALPDPVDMEEDEKEMLQEARARLANTRGKKAKRKAREKQLEEARRLAMLQKRRELKAAGLDTAHMKLRVKGIDYNKEIPFQRKAPAGFHDASEEQNRTAEKKNFKSMSLKQLDGGTTRREQEEKLREQDIKKKKEKEKKVPDAIAHMDKPFEAKKAGMRRGKLALPEPQVSEQELHELAKMTYDAESDETATGALLSSYAATPQRAGPGQTPARPVDRTPARPDLVMAEAQNIIRLNSVQTPLLGGDNPELNPSDFSAAMPKSQQIITPNPLATPLRQQTPQVQQGRRGVTPKHTPIRDQLNINTPQVASGGMSEVIQDPRSQRNLVRAGLSSLPAPKKNVQEYDIKPQLDDGKSSDGMDIDTVGTAAVVADAAEIARKDEERKAALQARRLKLRSSVLRRGDLPRPSSIVAPPLMSKLEHDIEQLESYEDRADELVKAEITAIIAHDAMEFTEGARLPRGVDKDALRQHFAALSEQELYEAEQILENEVVELRLQYGEPTFEEYVQAWEKNVKELIFVPDAADGHNFKLASRATPTERISSLHHEFQLVAAAVSEKTKKVQTLEKKLAIYQGGYMKRNESLLKQIGQLREDIEQTTDEVANLRVLRKTEQVAGPQRVRDLQHDVQVQLARENQLQVRYANLAAKKQHLTLQIQAQSRIN
jgi:pre-mRNA-splicing factor CDC5/CEF1